VKRNFAPHVLVNVGHYRVVIVRVEITQIRHIRQMYMEDRLVDNCTDGNYQPLRSVTTVFGTYFVPQFKSSYLSKCNEKSCNIYISV